MNRDEPSRAGGVDQARESHDHGRELAQSAPTGTDLTELQRWMVQLVTSPHSVARSVALREAAARHFSGNDRLDPAEQIDLYRQQFWLRHTRSLIEDFPGLTGVVGQDVWEKIAESYLGSRPPTSRRLRELGRELSAHLETLSWLPHRELCLDMARIEWLYIEIFDERDDPALDLERLQSIPLDAWPKARLVVSHALRSVRTRYPVCELRRALRAWQPGEPSVGIPEPEPCRYVLYRREGRLWDKRVSEVAFALLQQLIDERPLVAACEAVVAAHPAAEQTLATQLTSWLTLWGRLGWIVEVEIGCSERREHPDRG